MRRTAWASVLALGLLGGDALGSLPASPEPGGAGLALRAALAAAERGDLERADRLLTRVESEHAEVADHAALLQIRTLLDGQRPVDAVVVGEGALRRHRESRLHARMLRSLGDAYLSVGAEPAARNVWTLALGGTTSADERAELLLLLGESYQRAGLEADATAAYRDLWSRHPDQAAASAASDRLDALEAGGKPLRSPTDQLLRADALYDLRRNEDALAAYRAALAGGLSGGDEKRARRQIAFTLFRLRRYPEAVPAFRDLGREPEARIQHARSVARAGDTDGAVRMLEKLGRGLRGSYGERSRYLAALLLESQPPDPRAIQHFARLAQSAGNRTIRRDARWRMAWAAYASGDPAQALYHLDILERATRDPIERLRARYWRGRSLEQLGDVRSTDVFESIAAEYPLTYYGWRSAARLGYREVPAEEAEAPRRATPRLRPRDLGRIRALVEAGLIDEAREEIAILAQRSLSFGDRLELADLAADAGDANRAQRLVVDAYQERLARGPSPGLEELWWLAWPWVHTDGLAGEAPVDPELVFAVMREESGYRPKVVSVVGARGLLQIMPETGRRLALDLGLPSFEADDLFDPDVNVRLGSHYLAQLGGRFDGRSSAVIGSYNAGPEAVARWLEERGNLEDDEWVERIPYSQTRAYVKRVLRSVWAYRTLY
ncbi:MAG: transglycosylase SLT domain-containing protein [Myxococcota bacterium]